MKRLLFLLLLAAFTITAYGQTVVTLSTADTSKIQRTTGTTNAELILRNRDRAVPNGIWYNSNNGLVRFANVGYGLSFASNTFKIDTTTLFGKFIRNQAGKTLASQTGKFWISDTIKTTGRIFGASLNGASISYFASDNLKLGNSGNLSSLTTGSGNIAIGVDVLMANTDGESNLGIGIDALTYNQGGSYNTGVGNFSGTNNIAGNYNSTFGRYSGYANTGSGNVAIGFQSIYQKTAGDDNIAIGKAAASFQADGSTPLGSATNSIYIGANSRGFSNSDNNSIVIGTTAIGAGANTVVLGNNSITDTYLKGTVHGTFTGNITGNASTATALATGRTISISGDLAYTSPSFDGSGNVTAAGTLATVNSNVGTFTNATITVNGKGLITAASSGTSSVTTMANIGSSPNAAGASISGNTLTLQPANASFGGVLTAGTQDIGGVKNIIQGDFRLNDGSAALGSTLYLNRGGTTNLGSLILHRTNGTTLWQVGIKGSNSNAYTIENFRTGSLVAAFKIDSADNKVTIGAALSVGTTSSLTGTVGIGAAPATDKGITLQPALTGTVQYGLYNFPTFTSAATTGAINHYIRTATQATSFTMTDGYGLYIDNPLIGSGSTMTNYSAITVVDLTGMGTAKAITTGAHGAITFGVLGTGTVQATSGVLSIASDGRLKITDKEKPKFTGALAAINKLETPNFYKWNKESQLPTDVKEFSLYADKVHAVLGEEFAPTQPNGYYGLNDRAILSLTIQALQEAYKVIKKQDARILTLEKSMIVKQPNK